MCLEQISAYNPYTVKRQWVFDLRNTVPEPVAYIYIYVEDYNIRMGTYIYIWLNPRTLWKYTATIELEKIKNQNHDRRTGKQ